MFHNRRMKIKMSKIVTKSRFQRYQPMILKMLIAVLLLWFLLRSEENLRRTLRQMLSVSPLWLLCAFAAKSLSELFTAYKWQYLMRRAGIIVPTLRTVYVFMTGLFYGLFLPGIVGGDIARVVMVAGESGGKAKALASIFMQRNTGVAALLLVADIFLLIHPIYFDRFHGSLLLLNDLRVWFVLLTVGYLIINVMMLTHAFPALLHRMLKKGGSKLALLGGMVTRTHEGLLLFRRSLIQAISMSVVTQILEGIFCWCLAHALGLNIGLGWCCVLMSVTTLLALIPISFNGLGLREMAYVALLMPIGYDKSTSIALGLLQFGVIVALSLCCGV